jgi:hypothetical protein
MDSMEHNKEQQQEQHKRQYETSRPGVGTQSLVIATLALFAAAVVAVAFGYKQSSTVSHLDQQNQMLRDDETQMRGQIDSLTAKLNQMSMPPAPAAAPEVPDQPVRKVSASSKTAARRAAPNGISRKDPRWKSVESQLAEQQKQLKQTQDDIASTRSDLEGKLGSTRDELNGSIARSHDELVALEKRGERNYVEFDLGKSKSFEREGPIELSLRKADSKHQSYDLMMLVDDHQLSKKRVDLYEPIWLHETDQPQPVQVVVNRIDKNHVHGYVSSPKYKESELASMATPASLNPAAISTDHSTSNSASGPSSSSATSSQPQAQPVN